MRLKSLHIENFGNLSNFDLDLDKKIIDICENNGFGKTTVVNFIKVMFYGMKTDKKGSVDFGDREHFYPFSGGKFGGNLTYYLGTDTVRIERFFDKKSATADKLTVYVNDIISEKPEEYTGNNLFGLDEDSFANTVFVDGTDIESLSTVGVRGRLEKIMGESVKETPDSAIAKLKKEYTELTKKSGSISGLETEIKKLKGDIENYDSQKKDLAGLYENLNELTEQIKNRKEGLSIARKKSELVRNRKEYNSKIEKLNAKEKSLNEFNEKYPCGLPSDEEILSIGNYIDEIKNFEFFADKQRNSTKNAETLNEIMSNFKDEIPSAEDMTALKQNIEEYNNIINEISSDDEKLKINKKNTDTLNENLKKIEENKVNENILIKKKKIANYIIFVISSIFMISGVLLNIVDRTDLLKKIGFACVVLGIILLIFGLFKFLSDKMSDKEKYKDDETTINNEINNIASESDLIRSDLRKKEQNFDEVKRKIDLFYEKFVRTDISKDSDGCDKLVDLIGQFNYISKSESDRIASIEENVNTAEAKKKDVFNIISKYKIDINLSGIKDELNNLKNQYGLILKDIKASEDEIEEFAQTHEMADSDDLSVIDIEREEDALEELRNKKIKISEDIDNIDNNISFIDDLQNEINIKTNMLEADKKKASLLNKTMEILHDTDEEIRKKYVQPIQSAYENYISEIERELTEGLHINSDFTVNYERNGEIKKDKHLSTGQKSVENLCLRFAITDILFENKEKPFIILDDPFAFVDNNHMGGNMEVLKKLSEKYQILYFSCHESRKMY